MPRQFPFHFSLVIILLLFIYSCANRVTPTGGDKDVKPPVVKSFYPSNYTTQLKSGKIIIGFDEFIQLKDINKQLIISPLMDPEPKISIHKRNLIIQLPDSLKPNTTYTLNFGNSLADLNEGNSIMDFQFVFSTGAVLDSLSCTGKVMDALSRKTEKGITVMLYHNEDDSLPFKKTPDYFTRTDDQGNFNIKNISPGLYKLFALNDKNNNYKFDNPQDEAIAFADNLVQVPDSQTNSLLLFIQSPSKLFVKKAIRELNGPVIISFNKPAENLSWKILNTTLLSTDLLNTNSQNNDSLFLWVKDSTLDTLKLALINNNIAFDTVYVNLKYKKKASSTGGEKTPNVFAYTNNLSAGTIKPNDTLMLLINNPIANAALNQVKILEDSVPFLDFKIAFLDSLNRYLFAIAKWKENVQYHLFIPAGAFKDVYQNVSDTIQISFRQIPATDLGTLKINLNGVTHHQQGQLQLVNESLQIIKQVAIDSAGNYLFENISPGIYKARLLNDSNGNKKWDNGDYWKKLQPEKFYYYPEPIQIRSNWELEINMDVKF